MRSSRLTMIKYLAQGIAAARPSDRAGNCSHSSLLPSSILATLTDSLVAPRLLGFNTSWHILPGRTVTTACLRNSVSVLSQCTRLCSTYGPIESSHQSQASRSRHTASLPPCTGSTIGNGGEAPHAHVPSPAPAQATFN